ALPRATNEQGYFTSLTFSPDCRWATGEVLGASGPQGKRLWELTTGQVIAILPRQDAALGPTPISPDGKWLVTIGWDRKTLKLWETATGKEHAAFHSSDGHWQPGLFSPDTKRLAVSSNRTVILYDLATGKEQTVLTGTLTMRHMAFSPDGRTLATGACADS